MDAQQASRKLANFKPSLCRILCILSPIILLVAVASYQGINSGHTGHYRYDNATGARWTCPPGHFVCGNSSECLAQKYHCDGVRQCPNGEDEAYNTCMNNEGQFTHFHERRGHEIIPLINQSVDSPCELSSFPEICRCTGQTLDCSQSAVTRVPVGIPNDVERLILAKNSISNLDGGMFKGYDNIDLLRVEENKLTVLWSDSLAGLYNLTKLYLSKNQLHTIQPGAFRHLTHLKWLLLNHNRLHVITGVFRGLNELVMLWLDHNMLTLNSIENELPNCEMIELQHNSIQYIGEDTFSNLTSITILFLQHNRILTIKNNALRNLSLLSELDLSNNELSDLKRNAFEHNTELTKLSIANNPLTRISTRLFSTLTNLKSLDLRGLSLQGLSADHFANTPDLKFAYFDDFRDCRFAPTVRVCEPTGDGVSTVDNLLGLRVLRLFIWVVGVFTCVGNAFVVICRIIRNQQHSTHSVIIKNLCAADFMMGVYLLILGSQDILFRNDYNAHALQWMKSWCCQATGMLAMLSCEVSLFILAFMSAERFFTIARPYRCHTLTPRQAPAAMVVVWLAGACIAIFPAITRLFGGEFYGSNGVCFPLHIHDPYAPGWRYSAGVFIVLNSAAIAIITCCYVGIFASIRRTRSAANQRAAFEDRSLGRRFFVIVLTDALCWLPIIIVKILALAHIVISDRLYGWIAIFILPINSALNPIIYSLMTTTFQIYMGSLCGSNSCQWMPLSPLFRKARRRSSAQVTMSETLPRSITPRYLAVKPVPSDSCELHRLSSRDFCELPNVDCACANNETSGHVSTDAKVAVARNGTAPSDSYKIDQSAQSMLMNNG